MIFLSGETGALRSPSNAECIVVQFPGFISISKDNNNAAFIFFAKHVGRECPSNREWKTCSINKTYLVEEIEEKAQRGPIKREDHGKPNMSCFKANIVVNLEETP